MECSTIPGLYWRISLDRSGKFEQSEADRFHSHKSWFGQAPVDEISIEMKRED
jgi:hypothetical protein